VATTANDSAPAGFSVDAGIVRRLHRRARADRWAISEHDFAACLSRSVSHRFRGQSPLPAEVAQYLESLKLDDLALACACARGDAAAWEYFVAEFRPVLLRVALQVAPPDTARELADSLYGDLFGLDDRDGTRRSLFNYFHGRSSLAGWLRAVLAQRMVDHHRTTRRLDPLPEHDGAVQLVDAAPPPDVDRSRYQPLVRAALLAALAALIPRDRLRLSLYYAQELKLAAVGRLLGESEATVSRKLERTRRELRVAIERRLRETDGLSDAQVAACFDCARTDPAFDLAQALPPDG
jgi:RNA polymerase sigma-70 factor (ECF subfamily)